MPATQTARAEIIAAADEHGWTIVAGRESAHYLHLHKQASSLVWDISIDFATTGAITYLTDGTTRPYKNRRAVVLRWLRNR